MKSERIAVIGGGPAGCAAAYGFSKQGHKVTIYEAGPALGGRTFTYRNGGFELDTGAAFITNFYPRVMALGKELGYHSSLRELQRITGLHHNERLASLNVGSVASFLRFPFLGFGDKLKMTVWTAGLTLKRNRLDLADPSTLVPHDTWSIGDMARNRLTEEIYDFLVRPGIEPFWYFSCEAVSAALAEALTAHAAGAQFFYISGGIDQICVELARSSALLTSTPVMDIEDLGDGLAVYHTKDEETHRVVYDRVVLATTATTAARLVKTISAEQISSRQRTFLATQQYESNIHIAYLISERPSVTDVGSIFPCGPGQHPLAAFSFHRIKSDSHLQNGKELVSVYLSGAESRKMMARDEQEITERGWALAREVCPDLPNEATVFHLVKRKEAIPIHAVGRYTLAAEFQSEQKERKSRILFCGDYLATATVEGAIATGLFLPTISADT